MLQAIISPSKILEGTFEMMNELKKNEFAGDLPDVKKGEICKIADIWDGEGDVPESSYSYKISDIDYINYEFTVVEEKEHPLDTIIKITNIEML